MLIDTLVEHSSDDFVGSARSVADVLWSCATLQHWPPTLLVPVLTSIDEQLKRDAFEAQHLSTVVWALAKLKCKPVRLLERIESQARSRLAGMSMQNYANLLWGFATLNYCPANLLMPLCSELVSSGLIAAAKPVEITDTTYAIAKLGSNPNVDRGMFKDLLKALAARAAPETALDQFSSRQLVFVISGFTQLEAMELLPVGRLDEWIEAVRRAHLVKSLLASDANQLEEALASNGKDATWVKNADILNVWTGLATGRDSLLVRRYTDDELRAAFSTIDTDSSGAIDKNELLTAIKVINPDVVMETVEGMLHFADADGDLQVDFEEFKKIIRSVAQSHTLSGDSQ